MQLRDYQVNGLQQIRSLIDQGHKRILLTMPTGSGKGTVIAKILSANPGKTCLFLVHRRELVFDISKRLTNLGFSHSVVVPSAAVNYIDRTFVATIQSWLSRHKNYGITPDIIVIDECHLFNPSHGMYRKLLDMYPRSIVLGFTATPTRSDGRGLGAIFSALVHPLTFGQAFDGGYLVRPRYYTPTDPDLSKVKSLAGDFQTDDLAKVMDSPKIVGDIVSHYLKYGQDRKAIGFAVRVSHSEGLAEAFNAAGIPSAHVDGNTPIEERDEIFRQLRDGEIAVLWNVDVCSEGVDIPDIGCVISARPTKSVIKWLQQIGRGLRPSSGKADCIAEGSLVLTDHGLIPIEDVQLSHKLWDGCNWVSHRGTICHGYQNTIYYGGLRATPDHRVWTSGGWRTLEECAAQQIGIAKTGLGWYAVREGNYFVAGDGMAWGKTSSTDVCADEMRDMWAGGEHNLRQLSARSNGWMQALRSAKASAAMASFQSVGTTPEVHQPEESQVRGLWREGYRVSLSERHRGLHMDSGELGAPERSPIGPNRQLGALCAWKSKVVDAATESSAYPQNTTQSKNAFIQASLSEYKICRLDSKRVFLAGINQSGDCRKVDDSFVQAERRVWDILDAGPLHRFTVSGLLVHNCLVFDHGGTFDRLGPVEDYETWVLDDRVKANKATETKKKDKEPKQLKCPICSTRFQKSVICPSCGHVMVTPRSPEYVDGDLVEVSASKKKAKQKVYTFEEQREWLSQLTYIGLSRGYKAGWIGFKYKEKFGAFPAFKADPKLPSQEVINWVKHTQIRRAKQKH